MPQGVYERKPRDSAAIFWARVNKHDGPIPNPDIYGDIGRCWIWMLGRNRAGGYGTFTIGGKNRYAHVAAYILETGHEPLPEAPIITHLCDNGSLGCVRPSHLKADTQQGNIAGSKERGWKSRVTPTTLPIKSDGKTLISTQETATRLGVTVRRVQALIKAGRLPAQPFGKAWMIDETDLSLVADRKPGRPKRAHDAAPNHDGRRNG